MNRMREAMGDPTPEGGRGPTRWSDDLPKTWPDVATYYGQPILKEPEWTWEVPWYLFLGGLGGSASVLAAAEALFGDDAGAERARWLAAFAAVASPPLLITDLGRPTRFLAMLRVFKPTSAMSVGSWTLAAYSGAAVGAAASDYLPVVRRLRPLADAGAGALGVVMSTYTGVLVADSAIPVWHHARRELPLLFASSALGSAAGLLQAMHPAPVMQRLVIGAAATELAVERRMVSHLGALGEVYEHGDVGRWSKAAKVCTAAGAVASLVPNRWARRLGGVLVAAGGLCQRWSVYRAGFASAADPRHVVAPQRRREPVPAGDRAAPQAEAARWTRSRSA